MFEKLFLQLKNSLKFTSFNFIRSFSKVHTESSFVILEKTLENQKQLKFPKVWLRDNCQCEQCFHKETQSRKINWEKFNINVDIADLKFDLKFLEVQWNDGHRSQFDIDWLKAREFSKENREVYLKTFYRPTTIHWGKQQYVNVYKEFQYNDVMEDNEALRKWLEALAITGIAMIKNSPIDKGVIKKLANRIAFIKKTHYGEEFIVQAKPGTKNYAYLSEPLQMHIDLPYYEHIAGVNLLHCIVQSQSSGGQNLLTDGFYVADRLENESPKHFNILTKTPVDWNDIGQEEDGKPFHSIYRSPVICLGEDYQKYNRINYSTPQRDSHFSIDIEQVTPWYEAYAKFVKILHEEAITFKTTPGDILSFNNARLIHGRTGYDDKENNIRYIVGAYMDWDVIYAKLRTMYKWKGVS